MIDKQGKSEWKAILAMAFLLLCSLFVIAGTTSTVTLQSPASGTYDTTGLGVDFNFSFGSTGTNYSIFANVTLFLNGVANITYGNSTGIYWNGTTSNINGSGMPNITVPILKPDGIYIWNVRIANVTNNVQWWAADNYTLTVDTTSPVVTIYSPADALYKTTDGLSVKAIANDTNPDTCRVWVDGVINTTTPYANATNMSFGAITGFSNGQTTAWTVSCLDDADNEGWATNRTIYWDLLNPTVECNVTNNTWFKDSEVVQINFSIRNNMFLDSCELWGNFNRSTSVSGTHHQNLTIKNATDSNVDVAKDINFTVITNVKDTNASDFFRFNIRCNSSGGREDWLSTVNRTFGVDTIPPTRPTLQYLTQEIDLNSSSTVKRYTNFTNTTTVGKIGTDTSPHLRWLSVSDVNDVTVKVSVDENLAFVSPQIWTITGSADDNGTIDMDNHTQLGIEAGKPFNAYYYYVNVTDAAGNTNSSTGDATMVLNSSWIYKVSEYGINLTASQWNTIGIVREVTPSGGNITLNLSSVLKETSATYVAVYNITHEFETCSSTSMATHACRINVSQGDPVWIYVASNGTWDYGEWTHDGVPDNPVMDSTGLGYGIAGGLINITNITSSWNYLSIMNYTGGCTYLELQNVMNSTNDLGAFGTQNVNMTGTGDSINAGGVHNITWMSSLNNTNQIYYAYDWNFGSPWDAVQLDYRSVVAIYTNSSAAATTSRHMYYNRSGC